MASVSLSALVGSKEETVLALPTPFARAARFWKIQPLGTGNQPYVRSLGLCDSADCAEVAVPSGSWAVGETPEDDFPVNGFAAKWTGSIEIASAGWYTFYLSSRDGGRLYIDDVKVVENK